jgi:hypothetical protein
MGQTFFPFGAVGEFRNSWSFGVGSELTPNLENPRVQRVTDKTFFTHPWVTCRPEWGRCGTYPSPAFADSSQAKLKQMVGFKLAARPTISLLKLDSKQIVNVSGFAVFDASLATIIRKVESDNSIGWNRFLDFKTCA